MPLLVRAKRKVARGIKSAALMADSKQTELCTYLSAILLGGLLLNALFGWWWADPVAALVMVPIIVKEGIEGCAAKPAVTTNATEVFSSGLSFRLLLRSLLLAFVHGLEEDRRQSDRFQGIGRRA